MRPWLILACLGAAAPAAASPEPTTAGTAITGSETVIDTRRVDIAATTRVAVRVYSVLAEPGAGDRRISLDVAARALTAASVDVVWTICGPGSCTTPPSPAELIVRITPAPKGGKETRSLGFAIVDAQERTGMLATVFVDRTLRLASKLRIDHQILLGYAIAHELGHLLLATATHGVSGLMRPVWSHEELQGMRSEDWVFDPTDATAIRDRLASRRGRPRSAS
jgi:hypothetical protein